MPPELGSLASLFYVDLENNQLSGPIPPELANLAELAYLDLDYNQLSGSIPPELGNLGNSLQWLYLSGNELSGLIPPELGNLPHLFVLDLSRNQLGTARVSGPFLPGVRQNIPEELGALGNLDRLYLSHNQLEGQIPTTLGNLTKLEALDMSHNYLRGEIPAELGSLANLIRLDLSGNQLTSGIPSQIGNLDNLQALNLSDNLLSDSIPTNLSYFGNFECLPLLSVGGGLRRDGSPTGLLANLKVLNLSDNALSGQIPKELCTLANLTKLYLYGNELSGPIPPELGNLEHLELLSFSRNQLSGSIPWQEFGELTSLTNLYLYDNELSGTIQPELGDLKNLEVLNLGRNNLNGELPGELGSLTGLRKLSFSRNDLSGELPKELGNLASLTDLYLYGNKLSGSIPTELSGLKNLEVLNLSSNKLEYGVPASLGELTNLEVLNLSHNGSLTVDLRNLSDLVLVDLYVSGNNTEGCVPKELRAVPNNDLDALSLGDCADAGDVEKEQDALIALYNATDGGNWEFGQWTNRDVYPYWFGVVVDDQGYVTELNLQGNNLVGKIPYKLGSLTKLNTLRLERNSLSGCVPQVGNIIAALDAGRIEWQGELRDDLLATDPDAPLWEFMLMGGSLVAAEFFGGEEGKSLGTHVLHPTFDTSPTFSVGIPPCAPWPETLRSTVPLSGQSADSDRRALLSLCDLYSNVDGGRCPWKGWDQTTALSDWHGVETENGRVVRLELTDKGLEGEIPPQLGNLGALQYLNLSKNLLHGEIPPQLGNLRNLHTLALNNNKLTGSIPAELGHLGDGTERKEWFVDLHLQENHLTGRVPPELANIGYLRTIKIDPQREQSDPNVTYELQGCLPPSVVLDTASIMMNFLPKFFSNSVGAASKAVSKAVKDSAIDALLQTKKGQRNIDELGIDEARRIASEQVDTALEGAEGVKKRLEKIEESGVVEDIQGIAGSIARGTLTVVLTGLSFALDLVGSAFSELEKRWADVVGTGDRDDVRCVP